MDGGSKHGDEQPSVQGKEKASGMDSFVDSSTSSGGVGVSKGEYISMHDCLVMASIYNNVEMDIDKQKRGMDNDEFEQVRSNVANEVDGNRAVVHGALPAKCFKTSSLQRTHLTGAHDEPRQEQ